MTLELVPFRGHTVPVLNGEISRYNVAELIAQIQYAQGYLGAPMPVTTYGNRPAEPITNSFQGFVEGMLYPDGPVAAAEAYRLRVFGQAPILYQEIVDGRPGDLFDDEALDRLRVPWPGANIGDLMKRILVYGDFGGNGFILDLEDELVLVRPDWVEFVLAKRMYRGGQVGWKQVGIVYYEGGLNVGDGVPFLPGEYSHFVPGLPDPLANYRGMSWLTPLVREVQADKRAHEHKLAYFENAASPNLAVSLPKEITPSQFEAFVAAMDDKHKGSQNAYKTLYTAGGADVTVIGANMQQMDFSSVIGKGETRIANAAGVPPTLLSFSEGMQGSSLNAGNYTAAKRNFVDTTMRDLWANFAGSLQQMDTFRPPREKTRLWYDGRDIPFLHEDAKDLAEIQQTRGSTVNSYVREGWTPKSSILAVDNDDITLLEHTGLTSVQLLPPGSQDTDGDGVPDAEAQAGEDYEAALDEFRSELSWHDEIVRKFNPDQPRAAWVGGVGGKWTASGALKDALNLAGRIDLDPGEEFVGSDKIKSDYASVRLAATERNGRRLVRLGLGDGVFGGREDEAGPWRGRDSAAEENARRAPLMAEYLALQSGVGDMTPAEQARFDALDEMDLNDVAPSGHTARLDETSATQLRAALATDLDKALRIKAADDARLAEIDRLEEQREPLRAMARKWTAAEDARWDELTAKIEALEAADPYPNIEDLPSFEGSVPAEWADVHYRIEYFDGEVGATIGAVPHDSDLDLSDLSGNNEAASLGSPEIQRLIGLLDRSLSRDATRSYIERRDYYDLRDFRGRFRKASDRIGHALNEWLSGRGDADDPLGDADEFSTASLRSAAKEFGITVPRARRGASEKEKRDQLKLALLKDARARFRGERDADADAPSGPVRMTLASPAFRDVDVGVYHEANGKVGIYRLSPTSQRRGAKVVSVDSLDALQQWGEDNGEPQVSSWARDERGVAPTKRVPAKKAAPRKATPKKAAAPVATPEQIREVEVENAIRQAFRDSPRQPGDRVRLVDIRNALGEQYNRDEVDGALLRMIRGDGARLEAQENQQKLTQADRDAEARFGRRKYHFLLLDDPSPRPLPAAPTPAKKAAKKAVPARPATSAYAAAIRDGGGEGEIVRLLDADTSLTPARLRELAADLDIDVPADARSRQRLQSLIATEASRRFGPGDGRLKDRAPQPAVSGKLDPADVAERVSRIDVGGDIAAAQQRIVDALQDVTSTADLRRVATEFNLPLPRDRQFDAAGIRQYIAENIVRDRTRWTISPDPRLSTGKAPIEKGDRVRVGLGAGSVVRLERKHGIDGAIVESERLSQGGGMAPHWVPLTNLTRIERTPLPAPTPAKKAAKKAVPASPKRLADVQTGDVVVWEPDDGPPMLGAVTREPRKGIMVDWSGGRREHMTSARIRREDSDVRVATPEDIAAHGPILPTVDESPAAPAKSPAPSSDLDTDLSSLRAMPTEARRDALDERKVDELKAMLRAEKLPVSGRKRELVDRLVAKMDADAPKADDPDSARDRQPRLDPARTTDEADLLRDSNPTALAESLEADRTPQPSNGDELMSVIAERQGFDDRPTVVPFEDWDALVGQPGYRPLFRGVANHGTEAGAEAGFAEALRNGEAFFPTGVWGSGIYTSAQLHVARRYGPDPVRMALRPDARVVEWKDLEPEHKAFLASLAPGDPAREVFADRGRYAAARGYDAMRITGSLEDEMLVFNRSALLVRDARGAGAGPKAPDPVGGSGAGRDLSSETDFDALPPDYHRETNTDPALGEILRRQGFDAPPNVVSRADFDEALRQGEVRETWRGFAGSSYSDLTTEQMAEQYRTGDLYPGVGINGHGTYVAMRRADGEYYGRTLLRIGLRSDARVISADDLDAEMDAYFATASDQTRQHRGFEQQLMQDLAKAKSPRARANLRRQHRSDVAGMDLRSRALSVQRDPGRFAALRGYDAIEIPKERSPDKHAELIILNRGATIVEAAE